MNPMMLAQLAKMFGAGMSPGAGAPQPAGAPGMTAPGVGGGAIGGLSPQMMQKIEQMLANLRGGGGAPMDPGAGAPNVTNVPMQYPRATMPMQPMTRPVAPPAAPPPGMQLADSRPMPGGGGYVSPVPHGVASPPRLPDGAGGASGDRAWSSSGIPPELIQRILQSLPRPTLT